METATQPKFITCQNCDTVHSGDKWAGSDCAKGRCISPVPVPQETPAQQGLVGQVTKMLATEAYHYCSDCHGHCRQLILTVEALKESIRVNRDPAFQKLAQVATRVLKYMELDRYDSDLETQLREALRLAREGEE